MYQKYSGYEKEQNVIEGPLNNTSHIHLYLSLVLLATTTLITLQTISLSYFGSSEQLKSWSELFVDGNKFGKFDFSHSDYFIFKSTTSLSQHFIYQFESIGNIKNLMFQNVSLKQMQITLSAHFTGPRSSITSLPVNVTEGIVDPFDMRDTTSIKKFLMQAQVMTLTYKSMKLLSLNKCSQWDHVLTYKYLDRALIQLTINSQFSLCSTDLLQESSELASKTLLGPQDILMLAVTIAGALYYLILIKNRLDKFSQFVTEMEIHSGQDKDQELIKQFEKSKQFYNEPLRWIMDNRIPWNYLKRREKSQFLGKGLVVRIAACVFQIAGCTFVILDTLGFKSSFYLVTLTIGLGNFFQWIYIVNLLEYSKRLGWLIKVLMMGLWRMISQILQIVPVFMGYSLLGRTIFWKSQFFGSLSKCVTTLWSLILGDSISQIFSDLKSLYNQFIVILFGFSFVVLFMLSIHNLLIAVLRHAYEHSSQAYRYLRAAVRQREQMHRQAEQAQKQIQLEQIRDERVEINNSRYTDSPFTALKSIVIYEPRKLRLIEMIQRTILLFNKQLNAYIALLALQLRLKHSLTNPLFKNLFRKQLAKLLEKVEAFRRQLGS